VRRSRAWVVTVLGMAAWLTLAQTGLATVRLGQEARELGYAAEDCSYCHSFSLAHMAEEARRVGLKTTNCIACHGDRLPLSGYELFNKRGRFLLDEKKKRKADRPDVSWLKDYVEKEQEEPTAKKPTPDPGR
jgi:hypothetical protein